MLQASIDRCVLVAFYRFADFRPYRIQVHIGHGGQHRFFTQQRTGIKPALEKMTGAFVFPVCPPGDGLLQMFHEIGHRAQGSAYLCQPDWIVLVVLLAAWFIVAAQPARRTHLEIR